MNRTALVEITRKDAHPLYKKLITRSKKYKVDTGDLALNMGDKVVITEVRPISKGKFFVVTEVLK